MNAQMEVPYTAGFVSHPGGKHIVWLTVQTDARQSYRSNFKSCCLVPQSIRANACLVGEKNKSVISIMFSILELQHLTNILNKTPEMIKKLHKYD